MNIGLSIKFLFEYFLLNLIGSKEKLLRTSYEDKKGIITIKNKTYNFLLLKSSEGFVLSKHLWPYPAMHGLVNRKMYVKSYPSYLRPLQKNVVLINTAHFHNHKF